MSRIISKAEGWEKAYEAFNEINFSAFDANTIKESMIEYMKLYFPEDFNDYIESSEFIALLELFAYLGELMAYRLDLNAHENFLSTAQRKESVLRLAKLISYDPSRNIPARGLVKITSISTTETIFDSNGLNLANQTVTWNDKNNTSWKEQFILVMNRVLEQDFGTVSPDERVQVDDVLFELYSWDNNPINKGVFPYSATVSGESVALELVPVSLDSNGPYEKRPETNAAFTLLYGSDGLGDASDTTGFFCFTKQGTLQKTTTQFDGVTPNQTNDILVDNINETDIWINNINPETQQIIDDGTVVGARSGEWQEVDLAHAQNIIFNTNPNRNKFEVETLDSDNVRLVFGDGEFADIPSGTFDMWYRTSVNRDLFVPQNAVVGQTTSFAYQGSDGNTQTLTFTFSLISSLQNNAPSEDIEHIRSVAPAVYYTQDRMVNNRDYNTFMLQDSTILKLRATNRTYAGDSKYIDWHDASETYENVKMYGDDLALYYKESDITINVSGVTVSETDIIITNYLEPLLTSVDFVRIADRNGITFPTLFSTTEKSIIAAALPGSPSLYFDKDTVNIDRSTLGTWVTEAMVNPLNDNLHSDTEPMIEVVFTAPDQWEITYKSERLISESQKMKFWNTNDAERVITYDTLISNDDNIVVLKANTGYYTAADEVEDPSHIEGDDRVLSQNYNYDIQNQDLNVSGLPSIHRMVVTGEDVTEDGKPDNMDLPEILDTTSVPLGVGTTTNNYVFFYRETPTDEFVPINNTVDNETLWGLDAYDPISNSTGLYDRRLGRYPLNFSWLHRTPNRHLIDPSSTNIIDIFIISRGYYTATRDWLNEKTTTSPQEPTPLDLRTSYSYLLDNKMISDTVVLHPGKFKIVFGQDALPQLQAKFTVIRPNTGVLTNNQVKVAIVNTIKTFFDVNVWEFGETFYFTELATAIHNSLVSEIDSVVLTPLYSQHQFGDMFQVFSREDEIFQPSISVNDIEIVEALTSENIRQ